MQRHTKQVAFVGCDSEHFDELASAMGSLHAVDALTTPSVLVLEVRVLIFFYKIV